MSELGRFIVIEGGDGSGKGTQSELLVDYCVSILGKNALKQSFPRYGEDSAYYVEKYLNGAYGDNPNDVPADLASLPYAIDRYAASSDIRNHLAKPNSIVISDRYVASNLAHQGSKIHDESSRHEFYESMMKTEYEVLGIPKPSVNIVLLMPSDLAQKNVDQKEARIYTDKKRDIHENDSDHLDRAKFGYEELCRLYPEDFVSIQCVDEHGVMRSIEDIQQEIRDLIKN